LRALTSHPLFETLRELKGNPRACVLTEPLFGIPFNMFTPFLSVYMLALGVSDRGIGTVTSLGLALQILTTWLSGAIVDKYGRRLTLMISDLVAYGIPCLIWAAARDIRYFVAAAVINSVWRISHTAWTCLMIEDADQRHLVHIWTWVTLFGVATSLFAPLGGWFVQRFGLVPAVRGLYLFGFVMLVTKAIVLYVFSRETQRGEQRLVETSGQSLFALLKEYRGVFQQLLRSQAILAALLLMIVINIYNTVSTSFWGVLFTTKLGFPESQIPLYALVRSVIITACFFLVGHRLTNMRNFRAPLWAGFLAFFLSQGMLVIMPARATPLLVTSVVLEAMGWALANPMVESLLAVALDTHERARLSALVYMSLILFTSPFGWIAGQLSAIDRSLPFALNMVVFVIGAVLVWWIDRRRLPLLPQAGQAIDSPREDAVGGGA